jgi:uncharacterized protein
MVLSLDITPSIPLGRQIIQSYGDYRFKISDKIYEAPILVFPDEIIPWAVNSIDDLSATSIRAVIEAKPSVEIFLVGCGTSIRLIQPAIRDELKVAGIAIESMDTGAACRTFNVLTTEDRRVAAALIPVE